jgi:hypothetical protein
LHVLLLKEVLFRRGIAVTIPEKHYMRISINRVEDDEKKERDRETRRQEIGTIWKQKKGNREEGGRRMRYFSFLFFTPVFRPSFSK